MYRHILIPTDGSEPAEHGVAHGMALANKIARMVWAMMARDERYKEPVALAA